MNEKKIAKEAVRLSTVFGKKIAEYIKKKEYESANELIEKFKKIMENE